MDTTLCPLTGEPLPVTDPGRIVSQTACNRLRVATSDLADLMDVIDQLVAGEGRTHTGTGTHISGPRAPLNLGILDAVTEWRDTIDLWANELFNRARPGIRYQPGNWHAAQTIFTHHANTCSHWTEQWAGQTQPTGAMCIDEVLDAISHLEHIANPRETETRELANDEAIARLENVELTTRAACETIRLLTGHNLTSSKVRVWETRGRITPTTTHPKRYRVLDLLNLVQQT